ncbi:MAG: FGGY-family carbohydrate kinase [Atribacterota bacterium]
MLGTSGVVMAQTDEVKIDTENRGLHSFCYSVEGKWFLMGCTLAAGGSYQWLHNALKPLIPAVTYDDLNRLAGETDPGAKGLLFLPYLIGERTPHSDPSARGGFLGLSHQHDLRHLVRAVIEGVAFSQRESVEILKSFGLVAHRIIVSGGAARSSLWCQTMSDVIHLPVVTTNIDDPASVGAAIIAGVGSKAFGSFEDGCHQFIRTLDLVNPRLNNQALYDTLFEKYKELYQSLKSNFRDISLLQESMMNK